MRISRDAVPTFALILHEMATNALKYGTFSTDDGNITVRWTTDDKTLTWVEAGGAICPCYRKDTDLEPRWLIASVRSRGARSIGPGTGKVWSPNFCCHFLKPVIEHRLVEGCYGLTRYGGINQSLGCTKMVTWVFGQRFPASEKRCFPRSHCD